MDLYRKADDTEEIDMEIKAVSTYGYIEDGDLPGRTVIVVNGIRSNPAIITALANGADRVVAVSYTHLDVYKRQAMPWIQRKRSAEEGRHRA